MKITHFPEENCFYFEGDTPEDLKLVHRDLMGILMRDTTMHGSPARLMWAREQTHFCNDGLGHRTALHMGAGVNVIFDTPAGAMAFKLAYVSGEEFIPWTKQVQP